MLAGGGRRVSGVGFMMHGCFRLVAAVTVAVVLRSAGLTQGQTPAVVDASAAAQNKLLARRAAEADCYRQLAETVYGLRLTSDTFVRDFVAESDEIRTRVDALVRGVKLGPPRYYEDGTCEVDAEVAVSKVVTYLKQVHAEHYHGRSITTTDIEQIKKRVKRDVLRVTGAGAPRADLPPDLPGGVEAVITPLPGAYRAPARSMPAIWRTVPPQARLMAKRAARIDAMRKLLERIKGVRITADTLVRDFVAESDAIAAHADDIVVGAAQVREYLHADELIAEVTMAVPVEKVVRTVRELHAEHYRGRTVTTTDIVNIKKRIHRDVFEATGSGVPPRRYLEQAIDAGYAAPDWIGRQFSATGEATDEHFDTAQGKLRAKRAARLDAMRKLAEQIEGVRIDTDTTVRDFLTLYDDIASQVDAVLAEAVATAATYADDVARVTVSVAGADLWGVIHHHMRIVERRGPR